MIMILLNTSTLLMMNIIFAIENHVVFVAFITMLLVSVGKGWQHERGQEAKGLLHIREERRSNMSGGIRICETIITSMGIKELHFGSSIHRNDQRTRKNLKRNLLVK